MNWETIYILIAQILCSVCVVVFLIKSIPARQMKLKKSHSDLKIEVSDLLIKNKELNDNVSRLSIDLDVKNNLIEKQRVETRLLENKIEIAHSQTNSLENELDEKKRYLKNCWDKIKMLEALSAKSVGNIKIQSPNKESSEYNICKACDKNIQYCNCAR